MEAQVSLTVAFSSSAFFGLLLTPKNHCVVWHKDVLYAVWCFYDVRHDIAGGQWHGWEG